MHDLKPIVTALMEHDHRHPLAAYMRHQGYDPQKGGKLMLPAEMEARLHNAPKYVVFSHLVVEPVLVNPGIMLG